jgi:hypothetical protein
MVIRMIARSSARMILACLMVAASTACSFGGGEAGTSRTATEAGDAWITHRDTAGRFSISYPSSWERAETTLTPNRTEPTELVSVGTDLLVPTPADMNCAQASARALEALGDTGALISLAEVSDADLSSYLPRPEEFHLSDGAPGEAVGCVPDPRFTERVIFFRVNERVFFYAVFLGTNASATTRREAAAVLNSLKVF